MKKTIIVGLYLSALCTFSTVALAEDSSGFWSDFSGMSGGMLVYKPKYEGSNVYDVGPGPLVDLTWRDLIFLNESGLGAYVVSNENFHVGFAAGYRFEQKASDVGLGSDIGQVNGGLNGSMTARFNQGPFSIGAVLNHQFTGTDSGYLVNLSAEGMLPLGEKLFARGTLQADWADQTYMNKYFGVSGSQSAASGTTAFNASSGFKSVGVVAAIGYRISDRWVVMGTGGYTRLIGDAAASPVSKNDNQFIVGLGITHYFGKNPDAEK